MNFSLTDRRIGASAVPVLGLGLFLLLGPLCLGSETGAPVIESVSVDGRSIAVEGRSILRLPPHPGLLTFVISGITNANHQTLRIRHRLDGYDNAWQDANVFMYLTLRFFDDAGNQVAQSIFRVQGESAGWRGSFASSEFTHRREAVLVPPRATNVRAAISSAGPPTTVGFYAVKDLVIARASAGRSSPEVLLRLNPGTDSKGTAQAPAGWVRDGLNPGMAIIVRSPREPASGALAILDDDPNAHAEWRTVKEFATVRPGQRLLLEWDEMFSMGEGIARTVNYSKLRAGDYRFRVVATTPLGVPTSEEGSVAILVPVPYWQTPWFWALVLLLGAGATGGSYRYLAWQHMRRELARSENQRLLEHERVRIAQDIHDDLGARVTQISLVSGLAQSDPLLPEKARTEFDAISKMSRELVAALYETVWAVNPENDNLDALGNHICQMVDNVCEQAQLRRRLRVSQLPSDLHVSSHVRHNLCLAVKEAVHNVIKHAKASELSVQVDLEGSALLICVKDDGCGFSPERVGAGNGLANMKRRLAQIGGSCSIESEPGRGTAVSFRVEVKKELLMKG